MSGRVGSQTKVHSLVRFSGHLYKIALREHLTVKKVKKQDGRRQSFSPITDETVWGCYLLNELGISAEKIAEYTGLMPSTVRGFLSGRNRGTLLAKYEQGIPLSQPMRYF